MKLKIFQVDAFTDKIFSGNPAAVCPLDHWISDELMQKIAMENNLAETAFYVKQENGYEIRWFTPVTEVDLCGHATLASAFVLYHFDKHPPEEITFLSTRSGALKVTKEDDFLTLNFPADVIQKIDPVPALDEAFNLRPIEVYQGRTDYMLVYEREEQIKQLIPDFQVISKWNVRGVIVTAPGDSVDFVSRFFAPQAGIPEDPVTGSAHTTLTPYWTMRIDKDILSAIQLSVRKGFLRCRAHGKRIYISGQARAYMQGEIEIN